MKQLVSEELLFKLVNVYELSQNFSQVSDQEDDPASEKIDLGNKKLTFCIEGKETDIWSEYIEGS